MNYLMFDHGRFCIKFQRVLRVDKPWIIKKFNIIQFTKIEFLKRPGTKHGLGANIQYPMEYRVSI